MNPPTNPGKLFQIRRTRQELDGYLAQFRDELRLGTERRHLAALGHLCQLLIDRLAMLSGGDTLETHAYVHQLRAILERAAPRSPSPQMSPKQSPSKSASRPDLRLVK